MEERKNISISPLQERSKKEKKKRERIKFEGYQRRRDPEEKIDRRGSVWCCSNPGATFVRSSKRETEGVHSHPNDQLVSIADVKPRLRVAFQSQASLQLVRKGRGAVRVGVRRERWP